MRSKAEETRHSQQIRDNAKPLFKELDGEALGKVELNKHVFITDPQNNEVLHRIRKYNSDSYGDMDSGEMFTRTQMLKKYGEKFSFKIADPKEVNKINQEISKRKFTMLDKATQKVIHSSAIDVETFITERNEYKLGNLYSLSGARMFDNVKEITQQGTGGRHERALFDHYFKTSKGKWAQTKLTAAEVYTKQQVKYNKAYRKFEGLVADNAAEKAAKLDLITAEDVKVLNSRKLNADPAEFKKQVKKFINTKHHFKQSQLRPYLKSETALPTIGKFRNLNIGDKVAPAMGIYDQGNYDKIVNDYLSGKDIFAKGPKAYGKAPKALISIGSGLRALKEKYDATPVADRGKAAKEIHKEAAKIFQERTGAKLLNISGKEFDFATMKMVDSMNTADMEAIYSAMLDIKVQGNQGSEMETNTLRAMRDKIVKTRGKLKIGGGTAAEFQEIFGRKLSFMDGMGSQVEMFSEFFTKHKGKGQGSVGPDLLKRAFDDIYGTSKHFGEITGMNRHDVDHFRKGLWDRVFNRYAGNKSVEAKQRIAGVDKPYYHLAELDAHADAESTSLLKNKLMMINEIDAKAPSPWTRYKKKLITTKFINNIFSEDARVWLKNKNPGISDKQLTKMQARLREHVMRKGKFSAGMEKKMLKETQAILDPLLNTKGRQPKTFAKSLTSKAGVGSIGGMFGGALLASGVMTTANLLMSRMKHHPMKDSKDEIEGLSHNSMSTLLSRMEKTDFGSGRRPGNPSTWNTMQLMSDAVLDSKFAQDVKKIGSNYARNVKRAYSRDPSIAGMFKGVFGHRNRLLKDTGRVIRHFNESAGTTMMGWGKAGALPELGKFLKSNLVKPVKKSIVQGRPLSKLFPAILQSPAGRIGLAAGATLGIGLHLLSSFGSSTKKKTKESYTDPNETRINTVNSFKNTKRSQSFADVLQASSRSGIRHGGLGREMNRVHMTDFRSSAVEGSPVSELNAVASMAPDHPTQIDAAEEVRQSFDAPIVDPPVVNNVEAEVALANERFQTTARQEMPPETEPVSYQVTDKTKKYQISTKHDTTPDMTRLVATPKSGRGVSLTPTHDNNLDKSAAPVVDGVNGSRVLTMNGLRLTNNKKIDVGLSDQLGPAEGVSHSSKIGDPLEKAIADEDYPHKVPHPRNEVNDLDKTFYNSSESIYPRDFDEPEMGPKKKSVIPRAGVDVPVVHPSPVWRQRRIRKYNFTNSIGSINSSVNMIRTGSPLGYTGASGSHLKNVGSELFSGAI